MFSTVEDITADEMKTIVNQSMTNVKGDDIMTTLADRLREEGGQQGVRKGLIEGIELDVTLKFGNLAENQKLIDIIKKSKTSII